MFTASVQAVILCALPLFPVCATAQSPGPPGPPARRPPRTVARTERECLEQWRQMISDPRPDGKGNGLISSQLCANNKKISANEGRCESVISGIVQAYKEAEISVRDLCRLVPRAFSSGCDGQGSCLGAPVAFQLEYSKALERHNSNVRQLTTRLQDLASVGIDASQQYANDLRELKAADDLTVNTETARRHGGSTIAEALRKHVGQDSDLVLGIVEQARRTNQINPDELDRKVRSPFIYEHLQAAAIALEQKAELEEYSRNLAAQRADSARVTAKGASNTSVMSSLGQDAGEESQLAGLPAPVLAAAPLRRTAQLSGEEAHSGSGADAAASAPPGTRPRPARAEGVELARSLQPGSSSHASAPGSDDELAASRDSGSEGSDARPGSDKLRELLAAKLARARALHGKAPSAEGDPATGSHGQLSGSDADRKSGTTAAGDAASSGRLPPMVMMPSETEQEVRGMLDDFEKSQSADRSPASLESRDTMIPSSDSPSLFLRLRQVHVRCVKRGCVFQHRGKI